MKNGILGHDMALSFSPSFTEKQAIKHEKKNYNILKCIMNSEKFDQDPFIPAWVKGTVHTAERIGTLAVIGLFLCWLSVTLLNRDDERNNKFLAMQQQTNNCIQELTVAVRELKVTVDYLRNK